MVLCLATLSIQYISTSVLFNDDVYYDFYSERFTYERIGALVALKNKWEWLLYPFLIIFLYLKLLIVSAVLYLGLLLSGFSVDFKSLFRIALLSEFVFMVQPILRVIWFGIFQPDYSLLDLQNFAPFSLFSLVHQNTINPLWVYPLSILNIMEIVYIVMLSKLVSEQIGSGFSASLKIVLGSYGVAVILWVLCITFMTVSLS